MSKMLLVAILASTSLAMDAVAQASLADQLGPLIDAAKAAETSAPTLKKEVDDLADANQTRKKEYDLYPPQIQRIDQQIQARFAPIKATAAQYKADSDAYSAQNNEYGNEAVSYRSACTTQALPPPQYQSCLAWKSRLDQRVAYLDTVRAGLSNRQARLNADIAAFRAEEAKLLQQRQAISRRMDEIAAEMQRNLVAWQAKSEQLRAMQARFDRVNALCGIADRRCAQNERDGCEALKHCHSINWDGARTNLRPLGPVQSRPLATPNQ